MKRGQKFHSSCSTTVRRRGDFHKRNRTGTDRKKTEAGLKPVRHKDAEWGFLTRFGGLRASLKTFRFRLSSAESQ